MIALIAFGISKYNEKYNCTDDGCPDFYDEIETPVFDETFASEPSKKFSRSRMKLSKVSRRSA